MTDCPPLALASGLEAGEAGALVEGDLPEQAANEKTIASTKSRETISFAFFISISTFLINLFAFSIKREAPSDTKFGVPSGSAKQIYILGAVFLPAFQRSLYGVYQRSRFVLFKIEHYLIHF